MYYTTEDLAVVRKELKAKGIAQRLMALRFGVSAGWIGECLRGHYPTKYAGEKGHAILPLYLQRYLEEMGIVQKATAR